jgi:hypothetical protein
MAPVQPRSHAVRTIRGAPSGAGVVDEHSQAIGLLLDLGDEVVAALLVLEVGNDLWPTLATQFPSKHSHHLT